MQQSVPVEATVISKEPAAVQRNHTIDIFRILGAFCVVALHSPLGAMPNALALGIRLGAR
jgi:hypothetical protein